MSYDPRTNRITVDGTSGSALRGSGQFFVRTLREIAERPDAPANIVQNWKVLKRWLGRESENIDSAAYERIAVAWQSYMAMGIAPSRKLEATFQWCKTTAIREKWETILLPNEIRNVFDRMLASDTEIVEEDIRRRSGAAIEASRRVDEFHENNALRMALATDANGSYLVPPEQVGALFFNDSPEAAANIEAYIRHDMDPIMLEDYAASRLRAEVPSTDRLFDLDALVAWERRYAGALSMLPGIHSKVQDVKISLERARQVEDYAAELRRSPMQVFADHSPETATRMFFVMPDTGAGMRQMLDAIGDNQEVLAGLRKSVTNHIRDYIGISTENAAAYSKFLSEHAVALSMLFEPEQMQRLKAVGDDLRRSAVSLGPPSEQSRKKSWWRSLFR